MNINPPTLREIREWPATVGVAQAATALGVSRSHLNDLIRRDESPVKVLTFGKKHRVVTASIVRLLDAA